MKSNLIFITILVAYAQAQFNQLPPLLGGINEVSDVDDESIRDTLVDIAQYGANRIAVKRMANLTSSKPLSYTILRVISAKTQVVAGNLNESFVLLPNSNLKSDL